MLAACGLLVATAHAADAPAALGEHPAPAEDPKWPASRDGKHVTWLGRTWNTRNRRKLWQAGEVGTIAQRNATAAYLGEEKINGGIVELDVKFDAGILVPAGGGKHFLEIMSWVADRGDRAVVDAAPWSRIELANLGDRPRCIVWNYGPRFKGKATKIMKIGPAFKPDRWYHITFTWSYEAPAGSITIGIDDQRYTTRFELLPDTVGPGRFFLFGHVETRAPKGKLHFRNFAVK
jgi:hypothetical protein